MDSVIGTAVSVAAFLPSGRSRVAHVRREKALPCAPRHWWAWVKMAPSFRQGDFSDRKQRLLKGRSGCSVVRFSTTSSCQPASSVVAQPAMTRSNAGRSPLSRTRGRCPADVEHAARRQGRPRASGCRSCTWRERFGWAALAGQAHQVEVLRGGLAGSRRRLRAQQADDLEGHGTHRQQRARR